MHISERAKLRMKWGAGLVFAAAALYSTGIKVGWWTWKLGAMSYGPRGYDGEPRGRQAGDVFAMDITALRQYIAQQMSAKAHLSERTAQYRRTGTPVPASHLAEEEGVQRRIQQAQDLLARKEQEAAAAGASIASSAAGRANQVAAQDAMDRGAFRDVQRPVGYSGGGGGEGGPLAASKLKMVAQVLGSGPRIPARNLGVGNVRAPSYGHGPKSAIARDPVSDTTPRPVTTLEGLPPGINRKAPTGALVASGPPPDDTVIGGGPKRQAAPGNYGFRQGRGRRGA